MTEPTDAELQALWSDAVLPDTVTKRLAFSFARAVLTKWGTPPAVAGEPCGWAVFRPDGSLVHGSCEDSADACLFALSESEVACGRKPGYMAATKGWKPQPIYTTPQPTQAQAVAVPLTNEQIRAMCKEPWIFDTAKQWVRLIEAAHGIKGGQHGIPPTT